MYGDGAYGQTAYGAPGIGVIVKHGSAGIEVSTTVSGQEKRLRYTASTTTAGVDITCLANAIFDALASTSVEVDVLATATRITQAAAAIQAAIDITGEYKIVLYGDSSIEITATTAATPTRLRDSPVDVKLQIDSQADASAIFSAASATSIATDFLADATRLLRTSAQISVNPTIESITTRLRHSESQIVIEVKLEATGLVTGLKLIFDGSFAPDEDIIIDTEKMTIKDNNGNNLRGNFEVIDWQRLTEGENTLIWEDNETGRTIEVEVQKEDRTI